MSEEIGPKSFDKFYTICFGSILPFQVDKIFAIVSCIPAGHRKTIEVGPVTVILPARVKKKTRSLTKKK